MPTVRAPGRQPTTVRYVLSGLRPPAFLPSPSWSVPMSTPVSDATPAAVTAALDQVQADLTYSDPPPDPAERTLSDAVRRYLRQRVRDPLSQALVQRPEILHWCVHEALQRTEPTHPRGAPGLFRKAEPLSASEAPPEPIRTRPTRRTRGDTKGKTS